MSIKVMQGVLSSAPGAGFVTFPDGLQAFVPASILERVGARVGDVVDCRLVPNYPDKVSDRTPWRVIFMQVNNPEPANENEDVLEDIEPDEDMLEEIAEEHRELREVVLQSLSADELQGAIKGALANGPASMPDLHLLILGFSSSENKASSVRLSHMLEKMYVEGELAKCRVFKPAASGARASRVYWALSVGDFDEALSGAYEGELEYA